MITRTQATVATGMMTFRLLFPELSWLGPFAALLTFPPLPLWVVEARLLTAVVVFVFDLDVNVDVDVDTARTGAVVVPATRGAVVVAAAAGTEAEATGTVTVTLAAGACTEAVVETAAIT